MANLVEFLVKVKDLASGPLSNIANTGNKTFTELQNKLTSSVSGFNKLGLSISDIDKKINQLQKSRSISLDGSQIKNINREIDQLQRKKERLEGSGSSGFGLAGIGGLAAGAMAVAGVAGMGGLVKAGMDRQMTNKRFEVMAGKAEGGQLSNNLSSFSQDTIYGNEVFGVAQTMLAFGLKAKSVMPSIKALGDIAGGDAQRLESLSLAFSQVSATGRLMGQDLLQFTNAGFNPLQIMSEKTGKSMGVLKKEVEEGKISFNDVAGAIQSATSKGGRFFNMTNEIGNSAPGKLLALQGSIEGITAGLGSGLLTAMEPLIEFTQWLVDAPGLVNGLAAAVGALTVGIGIYQVVTKWAAISQMLLNIAVMWPVVLIAALVGAVVMLVSKYQGWGKAMDALATVLKAWCSNIGIAFKDFFQDVGFRLELFVLKIKGGFQFIGGALGNFMKALKLASEFKFGEAKEALTAEIKTKATAEIETLEKTRRNQRSKNLADFAANLSTIRNTGILNKLTLREGKSTSGIGGLMNSLSGLGSGTGSITAPAVAEDTIKGISSGGVRNITINVGKFFDDLHFHSSKTSSNEMQNVEEKILEMFMRVTNSGGAAFR